jgi:hypothetical protein
MVIIRSKRWAGDCKSTGCGIRGGAVKSLGCRAWVEYEILEGGIANCGCDRAGLGERHGEDGRVVL